MLFQLLATQHPARVQHEDVQQRVFTAGQHHRLTVHPDLMPLRIQRHRTGLQPVVGLAMGTPAYMSPEQVHGDPNLDARSDIYSLGATLYAAVTGVIPEDALARAMEKRAAEPAPEADAADEPHRVKRRAA